MSKQGKVSALPQDVLAKKDKVVELRYTHGMKQQDIAKQLGIRSQSYVAELLRLDIEDKVANLVEVNQDSPEYQERLVDLIVFMRDTQQWNYKKIAEVLGMDKYKIFEIIREYSKASGKNPSKIRYSLTNEEKKERNKDLVELSMKGYSVTEIASKVYLSKQRVSSIFSDMGYVPIKGRALVKMESNENTPELVKLVIDDCNVKLEEISKSLQATRDQFAMYKYTTQKQLTELRCNYMVTLLNSPYEVYSKPEIQQTYTTLRRILRSAWTNISKNKKGSTYGILKAVIEQIDAFESSSFYQTKVKECLT